MRVSWGMMSEDRSYTAAAAVAAAVSAVGRADCCRHRGTLDRRRRPAELTGREDGESRSDQTDCGAAIAMA